MGSVILQPKLINFHSALWRPLFPGDCLSCESQATAMQLAHSRGFTEYAKFGRLGGN